MESKEKRGEEKSGIPPRLPKRKYGYFRDDEIVIFATHQEPTIPEEALANNARTLNQLPQEIRQEAVVSLKPRVDSIRLPKPEATDGKASMLSMLTHPIENAPRDPNYLTRMVDYYNKLPKENLFPGLEIVGASPNWLTSVTSQGAGTGGPGSRPSPYNGSRTGAPAGFGGFISSLTEKKLYGSGEGVDVVILDTAPSAQALVSAPKEWPDHPLLPTLLGKQDQLGKMQPGKLRLYPAPYDEVVRLWNTSLNDHDYNMTDHGLFIAGIIHSIVPEARIHLVEVLNQYGVGDFASFVRGLNVVMNEIYHPARKMVINCSWMVEFPRDDLQCHHLNDAPTDPDAEFERLVREYAKHDEATGKMMQFLFNQFSSLGRNAVAAAGNDGRAEQTNQIPARFPAALTEVYGVGALQNTTRLTALGQYERSTYSNIADEPETKGIATFGGEAGEGNGVLGVYIGEFPVDLNPSFWRRILNWIILLLGGRVAGPPNITKWAWWAGTSFATPILTGAIAAVLSSSDQIVRVQEAVDKLYAAKIIGDRTVTGVLQDATEVGEDVMPVLQT